MVKKKKNLCVKKQFILKCGWQLLWFFTSKPSQNWKLQGSLLYFNWKIILQAWGPAFTYLLYLTVWF